MSSPPIRPFYSIIIAVNTQAQGDQDCNKIGDIEVDWVDFTREKSTDMPHQSSPDMAKASPRKKQGGGRAVPGSSRLVSIPTSPAKRDAQHMATPNDLSLQPLLGHFPGPNPLATISASGTTSVGRGVVHLFRHAPPPMLIASLDAHPIGESSTSAGKGGDWAGDKAEGEDGSLIAILAVPAWMRPADFLEFIGGWATCLEGVRMIRCVTCSLPALCTGTLQTSGRANAQRSDNSQPLYRPAQVSRSVASGRLPRHLHRTPILLARREGNMPSHPHPPSRPSSRRIAFCRADSRYDPSRNNDGTPV